MELESKIHLELSRWLKFYENHWDSSSMIPSYIKLNYSNELNNNYIHTITKWNQGCTCYIQSSQTSIIDPIDAAQRLRCTVIQPIRLCSVNWINHIKSSYSNVLSENCIWNNFKIKKWKENVQWILIL